MSKYRCLICRGTAESNHRFIGIPCDCKNLTVWGDGYFTRKDKSHVRICEDEYNNENYTIQELREEFVDEEEFLSELCKWANNSIEKEDKDE